MRRLDCSLNATLNSNIPLGGNNRVTRDRARPMHVVNPLPAEFVARVCRVPQLRLEMWV